MKRQLLGARAGLLMLVSIAAAEPVIYEGFNYAAGDVDGSQSDGTGMAGAWTTTGSNNPFDVLGSGLTYTNLSTSGGAVKRPSAPGAAEINRPISTAAQAALTTDNTTIWFSVLLRDNTYAGRYANLALVLATGPVINSGSDKPVKVEGGEGIGVSFDGNGDNSIDVHGYISDGGVSALSTTFIADANGFNQSSFVTYMIVGMIDWAPNGSDDTLTLYNIADPAADLPAPFATMTADLDQSQFDTLAIGTQQIGTIDEIRYGLSAGDVGLKSSAPPGSVLMVR